MPLSRKLTKDDCEEWKKDKNINPVTGRKIASDTITYKQIQKQCDQHSIDKQKTLNPYKPKQTKLLRELTKEDCDEWQQNKLKKPKNPKNPLTNYRLLPTSDIYKELDYKCENLYDNLKTKANLNIPKKTSPRSKKQNNNILSRPLNLEDCIYWTTNNKMKPPPIVPTAPLNSETHCLKPQTLSTIYKPLAAQIARCESRIARFESQIARCRILRFESRVARFESHWRGP